MDLILWRHADADEAADGADDLGRRLTPRGERQATRVALWLHRQMPDAMRVLVSPAERARRTAAKLERKYTVVDALGPSANALDLLKVCGWPNGNRTVLMVAHQPALGHLASLLLTGQEAPLTIRKGAVWWFRSRPGDDSTRAQTQLMCVQSPDTM